MPLRINIMLQHPMTIDEVVILARAYEQHDVPPVAPPAPTHSQMRSFTKIWVVTICRGWQGDDHSAPLPGGDCGLPRQRTLLPLT
jgi:hypothetical protein